MLILAQLYQHWALPVFEKKKSKGNFIFFITNKIKYLYVCGTFLFWELPVQNTIFIFLATPKMEKEVQSEMIVLTPLPCTF